MLDLRLGPAEERERRLAEGAVYRKRAIFNEIATHQQAEAAVEHPLWIVVPDACLLPRYSQIIIDRPYALNVKHTVAWLNHVHPNRPLLVDKPESRPAPDANTFALPCAELPPRPQW